MASIRQDSPFTSWNLSPDEVVQASVLSPLQTMHIQNIIASFAIERVGREIDPVNPVKSIQADAQTLGSINALQHLLDLSEAAKKALVAAAQAGV